MLIKQERLPISLWLRAQSAAIRRALLLWGFGGVEVALLALGIGTVAGEESLLFGAACLGTFIALFAVSVGSVCYVLASEIVPQVIRGQAMSLAAGTVWVSYLAVTIVFPSVNAALGNGGSFLLFAIIGAVAVLFTWKMVPDARSRSLEEIGQPSGVN